MSKIHKLSVEDFEEIFELSQFAFQYNLSEEQLSKKKEEAKRHIIWGWKDREGLAAKLHLLPLNCYINGKNFKMGGIGGVATWPEYRRQGMVKQLLFHALNHMKANGQTISFLHPFSFPFYRKYGWEYAFNEKTYTILTEKFKKNWEINGFVRRIKQDIPLLNQLYNEYAENFNGMLNRDEKWWKQRVLKDEYNIAVAYNNQKTPVGYVMYVVKDEIMNIGEMVYSHVAGLRQLLHFIGNHDSMAKKVKMVVPENDLLPLFIDEPRFDQTINPYFMARIVDVQAFLKSYPFDRTSKNVLLSLGIMVDDEFFPENTGTYILNLSKDTTSVTFSHSQIQQPAIYCSIQILSSMLLGFKRPMEYYLAGLLDGDEKAIEQLEMIIPKRQTYLADFF
ncbi:GNAT family N-acetyltransferase [Salinibacillus aidingensis]|uniref:GNAT family N-acetyltransferase n=1 Tax=Salinibacillus aidingensis TaxID=237684 RepID=A0ABP3L243_9BACI